jgi:hypothetical protein
VAVADLEGKDERTLEVPLAARRPVFGPWPRSAPRGLPSDVGYLRISKMDADGDPVDGLVESMASFRETRGLVIDVRGNGGGRRDVLRALFPFFLGPDERPRVANVAALRRPAGEEVAADALADRFLHPAEGSGWSPAARLAIAATRTSFTPEWPPPSGAFGPWCYFVLERGSDPRTYFYDRPVVILQDTACFSATDVFLGAFSGWPRVTTVGTPSGGGSGRAVAHRLPGSGLVVRLSSMASFRPDGRLYDGRGVDPDVLVEPSPTDLLGRTDTVLDAAVARLR